MPPDQPTQLEMSLAVPTDEGATRQFMKVFFLEKAGGTIIEQSEASLKVKLGSRVHFRIWGLVATPKKRLPLVVESVVRADGESSVVSLRMTSNEGWYVARLPAVETAFVERFNTIVRNLEYYVSLQTGMDAHHDEADA